MKDVEQRLNELDAKNQIMTVLVHALAATHPRRADVQKAFDARCEGLLLLWNMRRNELPKGWFEAAESARLAAQKALAGESPATH